MKKSFTSSDGGVSDKDKSTKETANRKKSTEIQSLSDANKKKELAAQQSKKGTESTGSIEVGDKKKSVRKPNETATPVAASAIAVVQETGKGIRVSRLTICAVCIMYVVSLGLVGVLGFWLHMIIFPSDQNQVFVPTGGDSVNQKATVDDEVSVSIEAAVDSPTFAPSTGEPSVTALPTTTTQAPTVAPVPIKPSKQQSVEIKNPPADSITPTITAKPTSSSSPSTLTPSGLPSNVPSTSGPTLSPSTVEPTLSQYPSSIPSMSPSISDMPSLTPTGIPRCPDELLKTADLGADSLITMRYEVVPLSLDDPHGGLFCVSIEYEGNAGWIGFAVSGASRDPAFGRKEAIIGIPGVTTLVAVAPPGADVAVGQQVGTGMLDGPTLVNPGKYEIPAGGGVDGYTGPGIETMLPLERQTLLNSSVAIIGPDDDPLQKHTTTMTFTKYLIEPDEIEIDPYEKTLFLYAVATISEDEEFNDNPEWIANYVTLLESDATAVLRTGVDRKRLRVHKDSFTSGYK
jgi:nitrate reductase NapE component